MADGRASSARSSSPDRSLPTSRSPAAWPSAIVSCSRCSATALRQSSRRGWARACSTGFSLPASACRQWRFAGRCPLPRRGRPRCAMLRRFSSARKRRTDFLSFTSVGRHARNMLGTLVTCIVIPGACSGRGERDQQAAGRIAGADYHMIEAAVLETARGRWFLVEYDRRRRAAETNQLLEAVIRLERALGTGGEPALMVPAKQAALPRPAPPPLPDAWPIASGCRMSLGTCASV